MKSGCNCKGKGYVLAFDTKKNKSEYQRCDLCRKFKSDEDARKHIYASRRKLNLRKVL